MKNIPWLQIHGLTILGLLIIAIVKISAPAQYKPLNLSWSKLPPLPDKHGFAGAFEGVSNGALIVAGGANFPDDPPWLGGKKAWSDRIFVLEKPDGEWKTGFTLPFPNGYGVSITTDKGLLCIGGSDADKHFSDVFLLEWMNGSIKRTDFRPVPRAVAYAAGARIGNVIYVAGGSETPSSTEALKTFWSLDVSIPGAKWQELQTWKGAARMLSIAAANNGAFYLFGGTSLSADIDGKPKRAYLKDAFRYQPKKGWTRIAALPNTMLGSQTPAAVFGRSQILIFGGDDGSKTGFQPVEKHPGFSDEILAYDEHKDVWTKNGTAPAAHVTTALVKWRGGFVIASGEIRPGVRSPEVWFVKKGSGKR